MARRTTSPGQRHAASWGHAADAVLGCLVLTFYAWTASLSLGFLDSPELAAAAVELGVPDSPGHPLPCLLGRALGYLPVGELAWRVNLASAFAAAAAAVVLGRAARRALAAIVPEGLDATTRIVLGFAVAIAYAAGWAAWAQAVRAEVYALQALLTALILHGAVAWHLDRAPRASALLQAGLAGGLALANHNLTAVLVFVPLGASVLLRPRARRPRWATVAATALCGVVGLAALLYLPVRATTAPLIDWGSPSTAARLAWTVSGAAFAKNAGGGHASSLGVDVVQAIAAVAEAIGPVGFLLALLGLGALRRPAPALGVGLIATIGLAVLGRAVLGFDPETPDHHAYLMAAAQVAVVAAALGAGVAARALARVGDGAIAAGRARALAVGIAALTTTGPLLIGRSAAATWAYASDDVGRAALDALPPRALAITTYFQTRFLAAALRVLEGARPDVASIDRGALTYPGARDATARRHPDLVALLDAPLRVGAPTPLAELDRLAATRPIVFELDPTLDPALEARLVPEPGFARYARAPLEGVGRADAEARADAERVRIAGALAHARGDDHAAALAALLWYDFNRVRFHCNRARRGAAAVALAHAAALAPGDATLAELAGACGLGTP